MTSTSTPPSSSMSTWTSSVWEGFPSDEQLVLAGRPLQTNVALAATSRFADDVWRLEPGLLQRHLTTLTLDFPTVLDRYRLHAKRLCYAMLTGPLPPGEKRQSLLSIRRVFVDLRRFLACWTAAPRWPDAWCGPASHG